MDEKPYRKSDFHLYNSTFEYKTMFRISVGF